MKVTTINATTIPDCWFQALYNIIDSLDNNLGGVRRYTIDKGSFEGQDRIEFDMFVAHISSPSVRPFIPDLPHHLDIPPIADGGDEAVDRYMSYLMTPNKKDGELYTYGERIMVNWDYIISYYKQHGFNTNRMIFQIGNVDDIFLYDAPGGHTPCLRSIQPRIYDNKLHFMIYFRSWDLWGGLPVNLGGIQQMKEIMVDEIGNGLEDGSMVICSPGLHLYDHHLRLAKIRLYRSDNVGDY